MTWTPDLVLARVIEAASCSGSPRSARAGGPGGYGSSWFDPSRLNATRADKDLRKLSWSDRNAMLQGELGGTREEGRSAPAPDVLKRYEEVVTVWVPRFLAEMPNEATCLWAYAFSQTTNWSFRKFCRDNGIDETTGRRMKDKALQHLTNALDTQRFAVSQIELDAVTQIDAEMHADQERSPSFITFDHGERSHTLTDEKSVQRFAKWLAKVNDRRRAKQRKRAPVEASG